MCRKAWSENFSDLFIDMTKNKKEGKYRFFNEIKNKFFDCGPESEPY